MVWSKIIVGATWNFSIIYNLILINWCFFIIATFTGQKQMLLVYIYSLCKSHFWWILLQIRNALKHVLNPKPTWFYVFDFCLLFNLSVFMFSFKKQKENNICFIGWHIPCDKNSQTNSLVWIFLHMTKNENYLFVNEYDLN